MGLLVLEDGTVFQGEPIGSEGEAIGPVIFDTRVVGYQEVMTDPANAGKILTLTYPLIGNYGISPKFNESDRAWIKGLIIKEKSRIYSNWQAKTSLDEFLNKEKIAALSEFDTRTLAVKIRDDGDPAVGGGEMWGIISPGDEEIEKLLEKIKKFKSRKRISLFPQISVKKIKKIAGKKPRIIVIDLGMLNNFLKQLSELGCEVILVPYNTEPKEIMKLTPDGIIISNGPEKDPGLAEVVSTAKELLGKIPLLGISTGHEVIVRALGGKVIKMKLGHHGVNYPVYPVGNPRATTRVAPTKGEITVQNHSWVVDEASLKNNDSIEIVERNLNDNSIEKIVSPQLKFISVQYYPTSPGLGEVHPLLGEFREMIQKHLMTR